MISWGYESELNKQRCARIGICGVLLRLQPQQPRLGTLILLLDKMVTTWKQDKFVLSDPIYKAGINILSCSHR